MPRGAWMTMTQPTTMRRSAEAGARRLRRDVNGILLLDKPLGLSSNAALQTVRAMFGARKAGHAGSLDPLAEGMLPICFGHATKICGRLLNSSKTYRVMLRLGARTASGDCETPIIERRVVPPIDEATLSAVLQKFLGDQEQVPPMHSAVKFEGKRLYELARCGETVERVARPIFIRRLECITRGEDFLEFEVECSKGTYVRTLAEDLAGALGTVGYVESLRRLSVDPFGGLQMHRLADLRECDLEALDALLLPVDAALGDLPRVSLDDTAERALLQGQSVAASEDIRLDAQMLRAYGPGERFLGLVTPEATGRVKPERLFVDIEGRAG